MGLSIDLISNNLVVILFYSSIILLVYLNRKKFDIQAKIIALYRTKFGLKLMKRIGSKHRELIKILGYTGIGVGFILMATISIMLLTHLYKLFTIPGTQAGIAPVIPGVEVPGSPIFIPLISGWIALFFVILIHEFSHGIVAIANKIKIKSSGIVFFGPIMGAFVEPDEKELVKREDVTQYSLFAAGPFSNILLALLAMLIWGWMISTLTTIAEPVSFTIGGIVPGSPAEQAGLTKGMEFISINNQPISNMSTILAEPNQTIVLATAEQEFTIKTIEHPEYENESFVGVKRLKYKFKLKEQFSKLKPFLQINLFVVLKDFIWLVFILSLGLGFGNLLPLGPTDGGRMLQIALVNTMGKKKGINLWKNISLIWVIILVLNFVLPLVLPIFS